MPDYIPGSDSEFDTWYQNFVTYLNTNAVALGADPVADVTPVVTAGTQWSTDYAAHAGAQAAAQSARQTKDSSRTALEAVIRALVQRLQASTAVDDAERAGLGITVPDRIRTAVGPPTTRPVVTVDTSQRMQHSIAFADEATPTRTAKPGGVMGVEIWVKVGDPAPTDPSELKFLATDTRTPYLATYAGTDANKVAHYMLRWVNTKGDKGPWSETASATIGA